MSLSQKAQAPKGPKPRHTLRRRSSDAAPPATPRQPVEERSARERDQLDLLARMRRADAKLSQAIVTVFTCDDGRVLVAFGKLVRFVATHARGAR